MYKDALGHADTVKNKTKELNELKKTIHQNLALVLNKNGNYKECLIQCTHALDIDEKAVKAYF